MRNYDVTISFLETLTNLLKASEGKENLIEQLNLVVGALNESSDHVFIDLSDTEKKGLFSKKTISEGIVNKETCLQNLKENVTSLENNNQEKIELEQENQKLNSSLLDNEENLKELEQENNNLKDSVLEKEGKLKELEQENNNLKDSVLEKEGKLKELEQENNNLNVSLLDIEKKVKDDDKVIKTLNNKISAINNISDIEKYKEFSLFIDSLSDKDKQQIGHFNFESLITILVQSGDLTQVKNTFDAYQQKIIGKKIDASDAIFKLLQEIAYLYNQANQKAQISLIIPEIGSKYDSETQARITGEQGPHVKKVLLPGLKNSVGSTLIKAVVML